LSTNKKQKAKGGGWNHCATGCGVALSAKNPDLEKELGEMYCGKRCKKGGGLGGMSPIKGGGARWGFGKFLAGSEGRDFHGATKNDCRGKGGKRGFKKSTILRGGADQHFFV